MGAWLKLLLDGVSIGIFFVLYRNFGNFVCYFLAFVPSDVVYLHLSVTACAQKCSETLQKNRYLPMCM